MEPEHVFGLGKAGIQAIVKHRPRARPDFLGRLQNHDQRARPFILVSNHLPCCADPGGHMCIVAAGVHYAGFKPRFTNTFDFGSIS